MDDITQTLEDFRTAMMSADQSALERLTADELSYGHTRGVVENKTEFIQAIVSGKDVFHTLDFSEQTVSLVDNVAIVRHRFQADVSIAGTRVQSDVRALLVWILVEGEWKLLARQAFKTGV